MILARFISISGPAASGKTTLVQSLRRFPELRNAIITDDMHEAVWTSLVDRGIFYDFTEIDTDSDYLCCYIMQVIDYYKELLAKYENENNLVILDGCWLDLSIYAAINMWYVRAIKEVQETILDTIFHYDDRISRIYVTRADDITYPFKSHDIRSSITNLKKNRRLELNYYEVAANLKNAVLLPSNDTSKSSASILNDLKILGYV